METTPIQADILSVNRFVSTFCGAFRAFHIYHQDNKALDEIMANLSKRFEDTGGAPIKLKITNRSLIYEGEPIGHKELTVHICGTLSTLGFKEIIFQPPLQSRHFFQILTILSRKEDDTVKIEKLEPFVGDGDDKPISLVPITANVMSIRLSDDLVQKKLAALLIPANQGGPGFLEEMGRAKIDTLPDLYSWICIKAEMLPGVLKSFVRGLADAAREGYFPWTRFLKLFPLPEALRGSFMNELSKLPPPPPRKAAGLSQRYLRAKKGAGRTPGLVTGLAAFSGEEASRHAQIRSVSGQQSALQDLDLAEALITEGGPNFHLGLMLLTRTMAEKNPVPVQERAFKMGMAIWSKVSNTEADANTAALLSALRQRLGSMENITLALFPLRTAAMDSDLFNQLSKDLLSLGDAILPSLIVALEAEQDRSMRKKICFLMTRIAQERGADFLINAIPKSSPFLLRNILMILGDVKSAAGLNAIAGLVIHPQKIVRIEALRSLCKIGNDTAVQALRSALSRNLDVDEKKIPLDFLVQKKDPSLVDVAIRLSKEPGVPAEWRRALYKAIGTIGGPQARVYLESLLQGGSLLGRFKSEEREDMALIKFLLDKMAPHG